VKQWFARPATTVGLDSPETTLNHRRTINAKPFLRRIYEEWNASAAAALPDGEEAVLELGSGAGLLSAHVPRVILSDIVAVPGLHLVADATDLPLRDASLRGIVMVNVLHHIAQPRRFFAEAARVVRVGGAVVMIEPWISSWSRFVYGSFHHEPCDPEAVNWEFASEGRLSSANGALPWMVFARDRALFEREFPQWKVDRVEPFMPFRYVVSGGLSHHSLMPAATFGAWRACERALSPWMDALAMFALVRLERSVVND